MRCASSSPKIAPDTRRLLTATPQHRHIAVATGESELQGLRARALRGEHALNGRRAADSQKAIRVWQKLVRGECSVLDSFESGGRLYVLAKYHGGGAKLDHLTARESEVLLYVGAGASHKATGYRLGLSRSYVSSLASSAMRKLGVRTQAELVLFVWSFQHCIRAG